MAELELEHGYHIFLDGAFHFDQAFLLGLARKGWQQMWGKKGKGEVERREREITKEHIADSMLKQR